MTLRMFMDVKGDKSVFLCLGLWRSSLFCSYFGCKKTGANLVVFISDDILPLQLGHFGSTLISAGKLEQKGLEK